MSAVLVYLGMLFLFTCIAVSMIEIAVCLACVWHGYVWDGGITLRRLQIRLVKAQAMRDANPFCSSMTTPLAVILRRHSHYPEHHELIADEYEDL